jgi:hypothetical protein
LPARRCYQVSLTHLGPFYTAACAHNAPHAPLTLSTLAEVSAADSARRAVSPSVCGDGR